METYTERYWREKREQEKQKAPVRRRKEGARNGKNTRGKRQATQKDTQR